MAVDMFLKVDDLKGESVDSKHKGEIDVLSWSWNMSQSGTTHLGSGGSRRSCLRGNAGRAMKTIEKDQCAKRMHGDRS